MYHIIRKRSYFEGWYLKQQTESKSIALIPSFHADADRQISARLQIITEDRSLVVTFSSVTVDVKRNHFFVRMGNCIFSDRGCRLSIQEQGVNISGKLRYHSIIKPAYNIMGPFCFLPGMQCRHSIFSLNHLVNGKLVLDGNTFCFIMEQVTLKETEDILFQTNIYGHSIMMQIPVLCWLPPAFRS